MFKVQQNRYLWVHLVGLATVPLLLDICLAGLASARPAFNYAEAFGIQFWIVTLVGVVPSLWMQIQKPFYIYSLPPLAINPGFLSEDDRRCLTVLKSWQMKALAGVTAGFLVWLLAQLYAKLPQISPVMQPGAGLVSAIAAFFFACLFLQISVSVGRSLLISQDTLQRVKPFEANEIASSFLIPGLRVGKILPTEPITAESPLSEQSSNPSEKSDIEVPPPSEKLIGSEAEVDESVVETVDFSDVETENQIEETKTQSAEIEALKESELPESASEEFAEIAAEMPPEEPPLVILEIIESDNFNSKDSL
ncbi:MAG: hypothetical protein DCF25_06210 [Leptolyngbya foveolarum]|uniref:Low-complexity tail membrane protein n=1 Tax=Leptolyngbya foveolarum TaxID=47253 RepID=A0A2W4W8J9_9CYAN|nr:MAG: hypothetical protein DCF25_06210 [Leptolyngbya foveolarum]